MNYMPEIGGDGGSLTESLVNVAQEATVLIVGNEEFGAAITDSLNDAPLSFLKAERFEEAMGHLEGSRIDCLVTDVRVDGRSIDSFLNRIRSAGYSVPFILWASTDDLLSVRNVLSFSQTEFVPRDTESSSRDQLLGARIADMVERSAVSSLVDIQVDALESMIDGVAFLDEEGRYQYTNQAFVDIFGYQNSTSFLGNTWRMCFDDGVLSLIESEVDPHLKAEGNWKGELKGRKEDGSRFPCVVSMATLEGGGFACIVRDVSTWRRTEAELQDVVNRVDEIICSLDTDLQVVMANDSFLSYVDQSREEAVGEHIIDILPPAAGSDGANQVEEALETQTKKSFDIVLDGISLECNVYPSETGVSIYARDQTPKLEWQSRLNFLQQLIDQSPHSLFTLDPDTGAFTEANQRLCESLGYSQDIITEVSLLDVVSDFSASGEGDLLDQIRAEGELRCRLLVKRKDGSTYFAECIFRYCPNMNDGCLFGVGKKADGLGSLQGDFGGSNARDMVDTIPLPFVVFDTDSFEVVEVNPVSANLFRLPQSELRGSKLVDLVPEQSAEKHQELLDSVANQGGGAFQKYTTGEKILIEDQSGSTIPVELYFGLFPSVSEDLAHLVYYPVQEKTLYEESLRAVNQMSNQVLDPDRRSISGSLAKMASLLFDMDEAIFYRYQSGDAILTPADHTGALSGVGGKLPVLEPGSGAAWDSFSDDAIYVSNEYDPVLASRSTLFIPLDGHGLVVVSSGSENAFSESDIELAEIFRPMAIAALERLSLDTSVQKLERDYELQGKQLEYIQELNDEVRSLSKAVVQAESREEMWDVVCSELVSIPRFDCAWIGEPDLLMNELLPSTAYGDPEDYLESYPLSFDQESPPPAVRAAVGREGAFTVQFATTARDEKWANQAIVHGFRSAVSVPIVYRDVFYGVLSVYSEEDGTFDTPTTAILEELGSLIGYALNSIDQQSVLLSDSNVSLSFEAPIEDDILTSLAKKTSSLIDVQNIVFQEDDALIAHAVIDEVDAETVIEAGQDLAGIGSVEEVDNLGSLYKIEISEGCALTRVASIGAGFNGMVVNSETVKFELIAPRERNQSDFLVNVQRQFPEVDLLARQNATSKSLALRESVFSEILSQDQETALKTAYTLGYFEWPKKCSGKEIAETLGIAQPTFSKRINAAQNALYSRVWGEK